MDLMTNFPVINLFFLKILFQLKNVLQRVISCTNKPNAHICTFGMRWSFIWRCFFPMSILKVKFRSNQNPWITKGIVKSSKKKTRLYEKLLKNRTQKNEETYKTYKNLFETIKKRSKKKFTQKNCKSLKVTRKKHVVLWKRYLESAPQNPKLLTKITVNKTDIFDTKE